MSGLIRTFRNDFDKLCESQGEAVAIITRLEHTPVEITYNDLRQLVRRCLRLYEDAGIETGENLMCLAQNSSEVVVSFMASMYGGFGFAPLPCAATLHEVDDWISLIKPRLCIVSDLVSEEVQSLLSQRGIKTKRIILDASFDWLPSKESIKGKGDPKVYLSTSGSTGEPKAMVIDGNRLWSSGCAFIKYHEMHDSSFRFWNFLPMFYLGGLFNLSLIPFAVGGSIVIDEPFSGKTFLGFWQTIKRFEINALWLVPTIVRGLMSFGKRLDLKKTLTFGRSIKKCFLGTAPIDLNTKQKFEEMFGFSMLENFALSETTFFSSETPYNLEMRTTGSVGEILPFADLKFKNVIENTKSSEEGAQEILVKSPFLFKGYLNKDGSIELPTDNEGYFATGDCGFLNEDNQLVITGRTRDIIKKGGYLVSLREIESIIIQHPRVEAVEAIKCSHEFYGETYKLFLLVPEGNADLDEIRHFVHESLVKYKWPEKIYIKKEFPMTRSGKVQKHLLAREVGES